MRMPAVGITCYPSQGGSGVVASELGLHLARLGCEVHFITTQLPFRLENYHQNIFYHPVELPQYPVFQHAPYTLSLASTMHDVALRCGLDILHVHYAVPHAAGAYLARQMLGADRIKVVTTLHGTDITLVGQEPSYFPITRFLIEQSDAVTAVSGFLRDETVRVFGTGRDIEVIPNFVDARLYVPRRDDAVRARFAAPGEKLLVHASNFRKVKNPQAVVEVFARVAAALPARLLLIGDGPEMPAVRDAIAARGLLDRVSFPGRGDRSGGPAAGLRSAAAAVPARVVRAGGPGGDGLRRRGAGDQPRRGRRVHPRRRQRLPARSGRLDGMARRPP